MPESKGRKKVDYTPPPTRSSGPMPSPRWYAPLMVALFAIGLVYIVVFYLTSGRFPLQSIGGWNVVVGFGIIMAGFMLATRWR
ncbi:MAG: cell division protein CrgA [Actinomycetota bacterium]